MVMPVQDKIYAGQVRKLLYSSPANTSSVLPDFNSNAPEECNGLWRDMVPLVSSSLSVPRTDQLFRQWFLESCFFHKRGLTTPNAVFILAQAPSYRMGLSVTSPISTSRYFQNYYASASIRVRGNTSHNMHSSLLSKAYVNPLTVGFSSLLKPHLRLTKPQALLQKVFESTKRSLSDSYRNLHYVRPSLAFALLTHRQGNQGLSSRNQRSIQRLLNLKSIMVSAKRSRGPRRPNRRREKVRRDKFLKRTRYIRLKPRWRTRLARRTFKKSVRELASFTR